MKENGRAWVAKCHWPGAAEPFWFGTVFVRIDAPHHEIEAAVLAALSPILPAEFPRPSVMELKPGMLIFMEEQR